MNNVIINMELCNSCNKCIETCVFGVFSLDHKGDILINQELCTTCGLCERSCQKNALEIKRKLTQGGHRKNEEHSGITVYAEHRDEALSPIVPQLLNIAFDLNKTLKKKVSVVLTGKNVKGLAEELLEYGVDEVWMVDNDKIGYFDEDIQAELLSAIIGDKKPEIVLGGATILGRSIMPRVASRLKTGLTADCTQLEIDRDSKLLIQTRPTFGGNIMAEIVCKDKRPQMATVRYNVMKKAEKIKKGEGKILEMHYNVKSGVFSVLDYIKDQGGERSLTEMDYIVSVGRGVGKSENLSLIEDFSGLINASIGGTRAVVELGWIPYSRQIGQTGKIVSPKIYFACGISGAIQHLAGIKNSDTIIAINSDADAPIFEAADYGIIGDVCEVIPELMKQLSKK